MDFLYPSPIFCYAKEGGEDKKVAQRKKWVDLNNYEGKLLGEIAEIFYKNGKEITGINVAELKATVIQLYNFFDTQKHMKNIKYSYTSSTSQKTKKLQYLGLTNRATIRDQLDMAKSYILLHNLRQLITEQEIIYHFYYQIDEKVQVAEFSDENILKYMKIARSQLSVSEKYIKAASENIVNKDATKKAQLLQGVMNKTFRQVERGRNKKYQVIHKQEREIAGFHDSPVYNLGHIYEAMERVIQAYEKLNEEDANSVAVQTAFIKALRFDSISGFKGGDVGNIQVKSGAGTRYAEYLTLKNMITGLYNIITNIETDSVETIKSKLISMFLTKNNITNSVNDKIDNLISLLKTEIKT